jgi:hypothetical protein
VKQQASVYRELRMSAIGAETRGEPKRRSDIDGNGIAKLSWSPLRE